MWCAGAALKFELAVGLNGRVWVTAPDTMTTIMVANAIQHSEPLSDTQAHIFVKVRRGTPQSTAVPLTALSCKQPGHQILHGLLVDPAHDFMRCHFVAIHRLAGQQSRGGCAGV